MCSQRELDAAVAKAAKRAGPSEEAASEVEIAAPADPRNDKERLIEELRREREEAISAAARAAQEAEAEAWLEAKREAEANPEPGPDSL